MAGLHGPANGNIVKFSGIPYFANYFFKLPYAIIKISRLSFFASVCIMPVKWKIKEKVRISSVYPAKIILHVKYIIK